jgi:Cu/Ag efflux protein CusF
MRKLFLGHAFALAIVAMASSSPVLAAGDGTMVTGTVTRADSESGKIVIDGETYTMDKQGGTSMMPNEGDKVSLTYEDRGGSKVVTRIGQATQ